MIIKNKAIYFKSIPEMFYKERVGIKCNTVRFLHDEDVISLCDDPPGRIHINESIDGINGYRSFVREISDISYIKNPNSSEHDSLNQWVVIFSWVD